MGIFDSARILRTASSTPGNRCAGPKGALRGKLIHNSIRQRIGKRHPQLQNVRADLIESHTDFDSAVQSRIARTNVRNERLPCVCAELLETEVDPICHLASGLVIPYLRLAQERFIIPSLELDPFERPASRLVGGLAAGSDQCRNDPPNVDSCQRGRRFLVRLESRARRVHRRFCMGSRSDRRCGRFFESIGRANDARNRQFFSASCIGGNFCTLGLEGCAQPQTFGLSRRAGH